jgi:2-iminobutanoate/2-iminopropanoate deaminase
MVIIMRERAIVATQNAPSAIGPYSQAVKAAGLLFISGQLPIDMATGEFPGSIGEQAACCLKNLGAIAEEAGTSLENAIKITVFLTDMADFAEVNAAYAEFFPEKPPARSCVAVLALPKNAAIEIEAICVCPE